MMVICRGCEGNLIYLDATETAKNNTASNHFSLEYTKGTFGGNWTRVTYNVTKPTKTGRIDRKEMEEVIESWNKSVSESEECKMKVSYKGFTGELLKLEAEKASDVNFVFCDWQLPVKHAGYTGKYTLELWDEEKAAKISFSGVSLKDVKFLGGEVTFG